MARSLSVILVGLVGLLAMACADDTDEVEAEPPEDEEADEEANEETDEESAGEADIELSALIYEEPEKEEDSINFFRLYMDRVEEESDGQIVFEDVAGPETIPTGDQMSTVADGAFDMVLTFTAHAGDVPEVETAPLSRLTPEEERGSGYYDWFVEAHEERIGVTPIGRATTNSGFQIFSTEPIEGMDDLSGMDIRSHSGYDPFFHALGMETHHMDIGEIYSALDRGVVEAAPYPLYVYDLGIHEVAEYAVEPAFGTSHSTWSYINTDTFEGMSEDLQELMLGVQQDLEGEIDELIEGWHAEERERLEEAGMEFLSLPEGEAEEFQELYIDSRFEGLVEDDFLTAAEAEEARELTGN
ncbi:hypothetical protein ER308_11250 [Egibacter rhizosphaerae]|uniref:TRAP transporter substrate-binding protein n=1 Tax=Egibacter rhizosphaerae TaxID=1670831 RepID=A0A411YG02_9ACTN|nr:TRAP transporter substrate-binding protein DctP [Egibacter rhizosphaerae]QBI20081.1 hypothetical protein ER308_11250 [Egibacter rhizosphaerae]